MSRSKQIRITTSQVHSAEKAGLRPAPAGVYEPLGGSSRRYRNTSTGQIVSRETMEVSRYGVNPTTRARLSKEASREAGQRVVSLGQQHGIKRYKVASKADVKKLVEKLPEDQHVYAGYMGKRPKDSPKKKREDMTEEELEELENEATEGYWNVLGSTRAGDFDESMIDPQWFDDVDYYIVSAR